MNQEDLFNLIIIINDWLVNDKPNITINEAILLSELIGIT